MRYRLDLHQAARYAASRLPGGWRVTKTAGAACGITAQAWIEDAEGRCIVLERRRDVEGVRPFIEVKSRHFSPAYGLSCLMDEDRSTTSGDVLAFITTRYLPTYEEVYQEEEIPMRDRGDL